MEYKVYLDNATGNMFVIRDSSLWSVNAVIVSGTRITPFGNARIFTGNVIDWRWQCGLGGRWDTRIGEVQAARFLGLDLHLKRMDGIDHLLQQTCKSDQSVV
jgi:hypothetical protein